MRLTILGGGGFRVPLVYRALLGDRGEGRVTAVTLYDLDASRLTAIRKVLTDQAAGHPDPPVVTVTTDLDEAVTGADFVFSAIRVGGLAGRAADERIALEEGVLGQETVGAGGISYGLRTVPVALEIARRVAALAPDAWVINFTNPAGLVTEAMTAHLGDRVIGICDSPVGLGRRVAGALGADPARTRLDYVGLNHLGWLCGLYADGRDLLPSLLADEAALTSFEEGKLFGADLLRTLGALPNEYLHYYYFHRESVGSARAAEQTRGAFLHSQQQRFYDSLSTDSMSAAGSASAPPPPRAAWNAWDATRLEREITYMAENRDAVGMGERDSCDLESGGYEQVALSLMRAIALDERTALILNVRNRGRIPVLDDDAVIEVPCHVDANGAHAIAGAPLPDHGKGLVCSVKEVERAVIRAATTGDRAHAVKALTIHPLIDSYAVAIRLLDAYQRHFPELAYLG
ncbi:6-phospho-beta-glucosidase [Streptomyces sp. NL15-2K]|uniref:6-phospho-beta-glucosidase n=1 Tax=Streptomyces sp. NL15-2K TaxID=376149 RepID=UPI000F56B205|nr:MULTISPECIES: 6-phospho-beta-glucosidase [Actinomycetes]WKX14736.1 6-phospho-beta-glucosidase [Kutzneria buriramensis]GCB52454.1 maltose-6'-phosphate glucosidase [Streptomyces sp. NL15-2K]